MHKHVQIVIQHREPADRDRKDFRKFLQPSYESKLRLFAR